MSFVRTFGTLKPSKEVVGVALKIVTEGTAKVTDIQLVPGNSLFSWSPQVGDLHLKSDLRWRYANGMIMEEYDAWIMSDEDQASPYRATFYPHRSQEVSWGMLDLGTISSKQEFNGAEYSLSTGAGVTPHLTSRSDQRTDIRTTGIMSAIVGIRGISVDPGPPEEQDFTTVIASHLSGWPSVIDSHETWDDVLEEHGAWS